MRSGKGKKTDPNRDIENFLSRFDELDEDSPDIDSYLDDSDKSKGSKDSKESKESKSKVQNFQWKDVTPSSSSGKKKPKDKAERIVTKDPAPSAIKVQRLRPDDDDIHTYPIDELTKTDNRPEAVEPEKASDVKKTDEKKDNEKKSDANKKSTKGKGKGKGKKKTKTSDTDKVKDTAKDPLKEKDAAKKASADIDSEKVEIPEDLSKADKMDITLAEGKLHELLADEIEESEASGVVVDSLSSREKDAASKKAGIGGIFSGLVTLFSGKSSEPEEIPHPEVELESDLESDVDEKNADIDADEPKGDEITDNKDDNKDDSKKEAEKYEISEDSAELSEESTEPEESEDSDVTTETDASAAAVTEEKSITEPSGFSLLNVPKEEKTPLASGEYILDEESGKYRKTDLGKRKRVEFRDTSSVAGTGLFGRKKKKKKKKERKSAKEVLFCKKNPNYRPEEGATYEKDGKIIKNKPLKFSFLKLFRDFVIIGLLMVMAAAGYVGYIIYHAPIHDYNDIYATVATASVVYNDEGKQIDNIYYTENRRIVKYEDMPEVLIESFVAIEDKTFWKHHGFNWTRMIGAVLSSITGHGQISGTSTITQQLARNVYLPDEKSVRTIKRKLLEMYYAARIEHALSKEEIVEAYLNTIYLGYGCYGVNSAARTYFSKSVKDLNLLECASLAALPQAPHNYALLKNAAEGGEVSEDSKVISKSPDKIVTNDTSKERRNLTLDLMLEQELITKAEHDEAYDVPVNDFIDPTLKTGSGNYSYFHEYLIDTIIADLMEQKEMSYEEAERTVYTGGLQIYSTLDSKAQNVIADEFKDDANFPTISAIWKQDYDGNILNNDGKIALYDYEDYFDEDDNFRLSAENEEVVFHDDGSATINSDHNLYIYETEVDGAIDYSIEFKDYYIIADDGVLFSIQGGYVNIPTEYKSSDGNGNVIVSADFFNDKNYASSFTRDGDDLVISETGYSLGRSVRQPQAAMVIVEVGTGQVKAMVGGRQFKGERLLNRAIGTRQPGSSIKPLTVYGAALQKSYELEKEGKKWEYTDHKIDRQGIRGYGDYITVHSSVEDERTKINGKYWPKNANGGYSGTNNFRTAIQQSINTCAVKIMMQLTPEYAIKQLDKFGITTAVDTEENDKVNDVNPAAMALGAMTQGVEPLQMALAYASFPGGGKLNSPICYTKILDRNGEVFLEGKSEETQALNEGVAWIMTDVLQSVVSRGIAWQAAIDDVSVGGKTGTTNDQYDIWFDGFTPSYAAALWIGTDQNVEMSTMSGPAAALWGKIMNQIPKAKEGEYREQPDNVIYYSGDYYTEGTEVGLSYYSYAYEKKKARNAAYSKWKSQRENHKKWIKEKYHYETKTKVIKEAWVEITYDTDEEGNPLDGKDGRERKIIDKKHHDAVTKTEKIKVIDEEAHWEYESGWRDGDFCYTFDGNKYCD